MFVGYRNSYENENLGLFECKFCFFAFANLLHDLYPALEVIRIYKVCASRPFSFQEKGFYGCAIL